MSDGYNPIGIRYYSNNFDRDARIGEIMYELEQLARQYEELKRVRDYIVSLGKK